MSVKSTKAELYIQVFPLCLDINHVGRCECKDGIHRWTGETIPRRHRPFYCLNSAESKCSCRKSGQVHRVCNHHSLIDRHITWLILITVMSFASGGATRGVKHINLANKRRRYKTPYWLCFLPHSSAALSPLPVCAIYSSVGLFNPLQRHLKVSPNQRLPCLK